MNKEDNTITIEGTGSEEVIRSIDPTGEIALGNGTVLTIPVGGYISICMAGRFLMFRNVGGDLQPGPYRSFEDFETQPSTPSFPTPQSLFRAIGENIHQYYSKTLAREGYCWEEVLHHGFAAAIRHLLGKDTTPPFPDFSAKRGY